MALTNSYLVTTKNLDAFLNTIKSAKAPERFTNKFLTQLDFTSSNDRLLPSMLKSLGLLDQNGVPTTRYYAFLDQSQSARVLADGLREAYADLFAINKEAYKLTVDDVKNKLRTLTMGQKSDNVIGLMANTFKALADLADWSNPQQTTSASASKADEELTATGGGNGTGRSSADGNGTSAYNSMEFLKKKAEPQMENIGLHYNIQIHLPESRDPAVYDAIFQALKAHLL